MTNQGELENELGDTETVRRHRRRVAKSLFGPDQAPKERPSKPQRKPKPFRKLIFLLIAQVILLAVWAALFFVLGMLTQYDMIPFLPRLIEALRVLLS